MIRIILAGATALTLAGSTMVYAQQGQQGPGASGAGPSGQFSQEDASAFLDARIAALHAGLKLSPDQDKNWPAFEQAYRNLASQRLQRLEAQRDAARADGPIERMQRQAEALSTRGAALKRLADAAAPLYQSLDDGQKRRFRVLSRPMGQHHQHHFGFGRGDRGPSDMMHGPGGMMRGGDDSGDRAPR